VNDSGTTPEEGRWLNYAELAEMRGITRKAAIRLTQRHHWRRQPGNDGATRVFVPSDIASRQTPRDGGTRDDFQVKALAILEAALMEANKRADQAEARAGQAEATVAGERQRADALRDRLAASEAEARAAQDRAAALQLADEARKARGLVARLRAAWRGK